MSLFVTDWRYDNKVIYDNNNDSNSNSNNYNIIIIIIIKIITLINEVRYITFTDLLIWGCKDIY